jgi:hypothetical protein
MPNTDIIIDMTYAPHILGISNNTHNQYINKQLNYANNNKSNISFNIDILNSFYNFLKKIFA